MRKYGKKYQEAQKLVETGKTYTVAEASELIKKVSTTKFDATVTVQFNLGLDVKQADQQLRGAFVLPNGTGKTRKVLAITNKIDEATAAGADFVGGKEMCEKIKNENWFGFDVIVATPDMMGELGRLGKILGPKGLMPNPKTGTVSPNIAAARSTISNKLKIFCFMIGYPQEFLERRGTYDDANGKLRSSGKTIAAKGLRTTEAA